MWEQMVLLIILAGRSKVVFFSLHATVETPNQKIHISNNATTKRFFFSNINLWWVNPSKTNQHTKKGSCHMSWASSFTWNNRDNKLQANKSISFYASFTQQAVTPDVPHLFSLQCWPHDSFRTLMWGLVPSRLECLPGTHPESCEGATPTLSG